MVLIEDGHRPSAPWLLTPTTDDSESQQIPTERTSLLGVTPRKNEAPLKIVAVTFALLLTGMKDGATGALVPHIKSTYDVGLLPVAVLYVVNFSGWFLAAFSNAYVSSRFGTRGTLVAGGCLLLSAFLLNLCKPPFVLFGASFLLTGLGSAFIEAQGKSFLANTENAHRWLGISHATYGFGAMLSPLVVTTIAAYTPYWHFFYLLVAFLAAAIIPLLAFAFKSDVPKLADPTSNTEASQKLRSALSHKAVWMMSLCFFLYVGAEFTTGGWITEFFITVRHSSPSTGGYVNSGFWGGLTLGRILLADITHKFGNRRMVSLYIFTALGLQFTIWFVPHIIVDAICVTLIGFCLATLFPTGLLVLSEVLPQEIHVVAIGLCATAGQAGSGTFPFLTGAIASRLGGVMVMQPIMVVILAWLLLAWILIPK